jgi:flavodoxin I
MALERRSIAIIFAVSSMVGFFVLGPLAKHRMAGSGKFMARPMPRLGQVQRQGSHVRERPISIYGAAHSFSAGCYGTPSLCSALLRRGAHMSPKMSVGLYYSTSTGNTETVAGYIADKLGIEDWNDIGDVETDEVMAKDAIIIGAPTWHTGADEQRSGTSWDEWLYETLPGLDFSGKKVAIFGVGDSAGYGDNFCDATGELYDCFTAKGAKVFGMTGSDDGFDYVESKGVQDGKFVGKTFDEDNYADDSEGRVDAWIEQLKGEGFM